MTQLKYLDAYSFRCLFCALIILICLSTTSALNSEEEDHTPNEEVHIRKPRFIRIFSRRSEGDNEVDSGRPLRDHVGNALEGGTIGIEIGFKPIRERIKRFFKTVREFFPKRDYKKSPWDSKFSPKDSPKGKDRGFDDDPPKGKDGGIDENEWDEDEFEEPRGPRLLPNDPPKDNDGDIDEVELDPRSKGPVPGLFRERESERNTMI